jgi:nicotinate-nucleotide adenylyltransferase
MTDSQPPTRGDAAETLCFGGSFNPIHIGHLLVARAVAEQKNFRRVVLIPTGVPPHKQATAELAAADERLAMCQLVAKDDPLFEVEDLELRRAGPSFTLDTARTLKACGWDRVNWLIGADMLSFLPKWHQPLELLREVTLWVVRRPGHGVDWATLPSEYGTLRSQVVDGPLIDVSASDVRRRVRQGLSIRYMVPSAVERYITERELYRS